MRICLGVSSDIIDGIRGLMAEELDEMSEGMNTLENWFIAFIYIGLYSTITFT